VIGYARQIWVTQIGQNDSFQAELPRVFVGGEQIFLYRDIYAQVFIDSPIDRTHPPLSEDLDNPISFM
jgi:hypothetical protein